MSLAGTEFARSYMEDKGWSSGQGLGSQGQGIVDAIKPKLKFDQAGLGHNRAEEYEFHWWDHVFNKAAQSVKVEDNEGEVRVDFNSDKSELSNKKLRKKAQKEMKNKLYSNFVKSGTLTGGKMEEEDNENNFVEDKDLSKLRELTDEELVAACGGRTAHKGSRHGHKMQAKLDRIAEAEKEYMEKFYKKEEEAKEEKKKKKNKSERVLGEDSIETAFKVPERLGACEDEPTELVKIKKKKKRRSLENDLVEENTEPENTEPPKKKKKHKKDKSEERDADQQMPKKKKHKKSKS